MKNFNIVTIIIFILIITLFISCGLSGTEEETLKTTTLVIINYLQNNNSLKINNTNLIINELNNQLDKETKNTICEIYKKNNSDELITNYIKNEFINNPDIKDSPLNQNNYLEYIKKGEQTDKFAYLIYNVISTFCTLDLESPLIQEALDDAVRESERYNLRIEEENKEGENGDSNEILIKYNIVNIEDITFSQDCERKVYHIEFDTQNTEDKEVIKKELERFVSRRQDLCVVWAYGYLKNLSSRSPAYLMAKWGRNENGVNTKGKIEITQLTKDELIPYILYAFNMAKLLSNLYDMEIIGDSLLKGRIYFETKNKETAEKLKNEIENNERLLNDFRNNNIEKIEINTINLDFTNSLTINLVIEEKVEEESKEKKETLPEELPIYENNFYKATFIIYYDNIEEIVLMEAIILGFREKIQLIGLKPPITEAGKKFIRENLVHETLYIERDRRIKPKPDRSFAYLWLEKPDKIDINAIKTKMLNGLFLDKSYSRLRDNPNSRYREYFKLIIKNKNTE
ncbi:MAG: hypothetical protein ACOCV8_00485 [Spirochaetota bacterium]